MYNCAICGETTPAGQPRLKHTILRKDKSIARELGLCARCKSDMDSGASLTNLVRRNGGPVVKKPVVPNPEPPLYILE